MKRLRNSTGLTNFRSVQRHEWVTPVSPGAYGLALRKASACFFVLVPPDARPLTSSTITSLLCSCCWSGNICKTLGCPTVTAALSATLGFGYEYAHELRVGEDIDRLDVAYRQSWMTTAASKWQDVVTGGYGAQRKRSAAFRWLRRNFGWVRFLVVRFIYKTNPNSRKKKEKCCGKKWPKRLF